jgi:hypothetical protein
VTHIAQGWKVTDPQALADIGAVPDHETLIEIPEDVLKMYARRYLEQAGTQIRRGTLYRLAYSDRAVMFVENRLAAVPRPHARRERDP